MLLLDHATEYKHLDDIALRTGTDKGSYFHNYTDCYAHYLAPLREKAIKFLEIGVAHGRSARMWDEYFKYAELHFMDITLAGCQYFSKRAHYHEYDQENPEHLASLIKSTGGAFDVILDDGGHRMDQQITCFTHLFPHVKKGGLYIIEDLHTSYWKEFGGGGECTTVNFLKSLVDEINYIGANTGRASHLSLPNFILDKMNLYREMIFSIHFYDSVAIILKR